MACPLFLPSSPLADFEDLYTGACAAQPGSLIPSDTLRHCCNAGYARGSCEHAAKSEADAYRFLIKSNLGGGVEVAWSSERDHHPVAVGKLLVIGSAAVDDPLQRQARACAAAYLQQKRS
ncbi:MAG TPA: hypothetical protein VK789_25450 [Bryobacteraceae bacterium]|nr:hypothetical protein [Bryobacteraceae bacterium]